MAFFFFFLTGGKEKDSKLNELKLFYFTRLSEYVCISGILSGKRQPPINLSCLYSYLTHFRQLGPSWGMNKKEVGGRVGRMLLSFSLSSEKNNGLKRSGLASF